MDKPVRNLHINRTERDGFAVGVYLPDGSRVSGTYFYGWRAILKLIDRIEEAHDVRVFVRSDLAVNTPDGLVF